MIEVEGEPGAVARFAAALAREAPPLARVDDVVAIAARAAAARRGSRSSPSPRRAAAHGADPAGRRRPATTACASCFDPADRRYRYPFLNCTNCGPRFTIVTGVPYDRPRTTMAGFPLCADCRREYEDPADRRFHAEPIACPACGPRLSLPLEDAVARAARRRRSLAVKGLGGCHLACDATDEAAVARLRARKHREEKPLAVMTPDPDALASSSRRRSARCSRAPARPIVLVPPPRAARRSRRRWRRARRGSGSCSRTRRSTTCSATTPACRSC